MSQLYLTVMDIEVIKGHNPDQAYSENLNKDISCWWKWGLHWSTFELLNGATFMPELFETGQFG